MHFGFVPVDTKFFGYVILIGFKTQVYKQIAAVCGEQTEQK